MMFASFRSKGTTPCFNDKMVAVQPASYVTYTFVDFIAVRLHGSVADTQRIVECRPRICGSGFDFEDVRDR